MPGTGADVHAAFVALLSTCHQLDGKDALHIVYAALLGCDSFVSRDDDLHYVAKLTVYSPRIPKA